MTEDVESVGADKPKAARGLRVLTDDVLDGFDLEDIRCRSCSGYGNCGFKSMFLKPEGGVASVCMNTRRKLQCERDGIPFENL